MLSFAPPIEDGGRPEISGKSLLQTDDNQEKQVCTFLPVSPVREQTGGEKFALLLSPWQPLVKFLVSREKTKIGVGIPEMNQKDEPSSGD
jgi:hypothetical protein